MTIFLPLLVSTTQKNIVVGILVLMFIAMVVAVCTFVYSLWKQRQYNSTSLPSIEVVKEDETTEELASAFALADLEDPISKTAYATRLDDFSIDTLPELQGIKYEPEEVGLPSLDSLAPSTAPQQNLPEMPSYDEPAEELLSDDEEYDWAAPEIAVPEIPEPELPEPEVAQTAIPSPIIVEPAEEKPEEKPESVVEHQSLPAVEETPVNAPYRSFRDGDWASVGRVEDSEQETAPPPRGHAYPTFSDDVPESSSPEQVNHEQPEGPSSEVDEQNPAKTTPRRGFRKLRMPVDKINNNAEGVTQETEAPTDETYEGRRKSNAPTDS